MLYWISTCAHPCKSCRQSCQACSRGTVRLLCLSAWNLLHRTSLCGICVAKQADDYGQEVDSRALYDLRCQSSSIHAEVWM